MIATPLSSLLLALSCAGADPVPPPGMVFLKGGRVKIGLDQDAAKELILESGKISIWGETPEHQVKLDDFFLMITEVTNEQFAEYVADTNTKPPEHWGKKSIDAAQAAFLQEQGKRRKEATDAGETPPDREPFHRDVWWKLNWAESEWELPKGSEALPVTHVDLDQARGYARWTGLRLPTEAEFQRAVRGKNNYTYPWGNEWPSADAKQEKAPIMAVTIEAKEAGMRDIQPVGSAPLGASEEGVLDLAGNVWEWTDSPYAPFDKYEPDSIKLKERGNTRYIDLLCDFDLNVNVATGGSYANDFLAARATTRRPTARFQTTNALGFRCAATPRIGYDMARIAHEDDLNRSVRGDLDFDFSLTVSMDRWKTRRGTASQRYGDQNGSNPLGGYAVITDYDYFLFTPVSEISGSNVKKLAKDTVDGDPLVLGFISTTLPLTEPALEPGTYVLAWRGPGVSRKRAEKTEGEDGEEVDARPTLVEELGLDPDVENFLFLSGNGKPLVGMPSRGLTYDRLREGTVKSTQIPGDESEGIQAHDLLVLSAAVPAGNRGFLFELPLKHDNGAHTRDRRR